VFDWVLASWCGLGRRVADVAAVSSALVELLHACVQVSEAWFGWFGKAARDLAMATEPSMGGSGHGHGEGWVNAGLVHACAGERALGGRSGLLD
jgi:hypothetical protein